MGKKKQWVGVRGCGYLKCACTFECVCVGARNWYVCLCATDREDIREKLKRGVRCRTTEVNIGSGGQRKGARGWPPKIQDKLPRLKIGACQ